MIRTARTALVAASLAACLGVGALPAVGGQAALAATTATVAGLPAGIPPAALKTEPPLPKPAGWPFPEAFPRTSGTGRMAGGAFEWSDFIYDDHGAQGIQVQSPVASSSPWKGTYTYADPQADNNGADIFRTAVADDGSSTWWRVDWNTLVDRHVPIAEWALDTDGNATTGSTAWPGGAGVNSPGIDRAIIASGTGAWLVTNPATGAATDIVAKGGALLVDMQARSFMVRIPHSLLNPSGTWQVRLASGVAASDGRSFAPVDSSHGALSGQPAVYNAAFRDYTDEPAGGLNYWFENTQATALSQNDLSNFSTTIRWAQLAAKTTTPEPQPTGYTNRWYVSSIEMGQGWLPEPQQDYRPNFLGRVQPYGIYVPTNYNPSRQAWPLTWVLHSYSNGQNEYGARDPNLLHDACEVRDSICATTLGRGPDGWYLDEAELDFWEVWNRISASYRLDADRTVISGYSMGGFGTYRLALGHPDLFTRPFAL